MGTEYKIADVHKLIEYTISYLGLPVDSLFNRFYTIAARQILPGDVVEVGLYLDPTGEKSLLDLTDNNIGKYIIEPDVYIVEVGFIGVGDPIDIRVDKEQLSQLKREDNGKRPCFIVLRRIGDPSVYHMVKHNHENVYLMTRTDSINYYETLTADYGYKALNSNIISQKEIDSNPFMFNILEY